MTRPIHDAALPGLAAALDPHEVQQALQRALTAAGEVVSVSDVTVSEVRYEPGSRAEILYRVKLREAGANRSDKVVLGGKLQASGMGEPPPAALLERYVGWAGRRLDSAILWLPELQLRLVAYPIDPDLPTLFDALSAEAVQAGLDELWRPRNVRVRSVRVEALGYTAHNRAAFGYEVLAEDRRTRVPELRRLIGKLHGRKPADRLFAGSWALWRAAESRCRLAPPVGYLPALGITLQEQVRGERLGGLASKSVFGRRVRQTARALAALHDAEIPLATRRKPNEEARVVHRWSNVLIGIRPDLGERITRLRDRLAAALEVRTDLKGPVHADFHHTNVLVDADDITIIDLDEMAYGDPLLDVGRFLASLRIPSLRAFGDMDALADARGSFIEEYLRRRSEDERRVRLFEAACLFTAAASAFRIQRPTWPAEVELLVDEAQRVFALAAPAASTAKTAAQKSTSDPPADPGPFPVVSEPRAWATDTTYMQALLSAAVGDSYGATLERLTAVPGEGEILAEYELKGRAGGERWTALLHGVHLPGGSAATLRRLELLNEALRNVPHAPALPRPVLHVRQLGMMVVELPRGERLSALLDSQAAAAAVAELGRALAVLQAAGVELDRTRSWQGELEQLERRVRRLRAEQPALYPEASELLALLHERSGTVPRELLPAVPTVRLHDVVFCDGMIALRRTDSPLLAPAFLPAADFLARLTLAGLQRPGVFDEPLLRHRFRSCYTAAGGRDPGRGAAALEAAALLRLAVTTATKQGHSPRLPGQLLAAGAGQLQEGAHE